MKQDNDISEYSIVFYKEQTVVGVSNFVSTKEQAKELANGVAGLYGAYLPNDGDFDMVGYIKTFPMEIILENDALEGEFYDAGL